MLNLKMLNFSIPTEKNKIQLFFYQPLCKVINILCGQECIEGGCLSGTLGPGQKGP